MFYQHHASSTDLDLWPILICITNGFGFCDLIQVVKKRILKVSFTTIWIATIEYWPKTRNQCDAVNNIVKHCFHVTTFTMSDKLWRSVWKETINVWRRRSILSLGIVTCYNSGYTSEVAMLNYSQIVLCLLCLNEANSVSSTKWRENQMFVFLMCFSFTQVLQTFTWSQRRSCIQSRALLMVMPAWNEEDTNIRKFS